MADATALVRQDKPDTVLAYICTQCGQVHVPNIYAGTDHAKALEFTKNAADNCSGCADRSDQQDHSREDRRQRQNEQRAKRIAKAVVVTGLDFCFCDETHDAHADIESAREAGCTGVFGSTFKPFSTDIDDIIDAILSDHHEDASRRDLIGIEDLKNSIDTFNKRQTGGSYTMNDAIWEEVPQNETFAMIKPDATVRGVEDAMIADMKAAGFEVLSSEKRRLTREEAEHLYAEHAKRDHFNDLVDYTISGDVVLLHLHSDDPRTPEKFRELMGPTDRTKADPHTLRAKYAVGYRENSIHGSDSAKAARDEIAYFIG